MTAEVIHQTALGRAGTPILEIPSDAIVSTQAGCGQVWVADRQQSQATPRQVTIAAYVGDGRVAVTDGLRPDDWVVTAGRHFVQPGARLTFTATGD